MKAPFPWFGGKNQENRHKERLWFSPHCIRVAPGLFDGVAYANA